MKTTFKTVIVLFALLFTTVNLMAQDSYNLKLKFEKGKTYFYRSTSNVESTQNVMGQEMSSSTNSKSKMRLEITDVTPAQFEVITSFDSVYSKTSSVQGEMENKGENVVGKKTKFVYDLFGKRLNKIEMDKIANSGMGDLGGSSNIFYEMTNKGVKVGDTWNVSRTDTTNTGEEGKMIVKSDMNFKVDGKEKFNGAECLKVSLNGTMKLEGAMAQGGFNIVLEGTGKINGHFMYDVAKGLMTYTENNADMDLNAAIPEQSLTIPITNKMKTKTELTEK